MQLVIGREYPQTLSPISYAQHHLQTPKKTTNIADAQNGHINSVIGGSREHQTRKIIISHTSNSVSVDLGSTRADLDCVTSLQDNQCPIQRLLRITLGIYEVTTKRC